MDSSGPDLEKLQAERREPDTGGVAHLQGGRRGVERRLQALVDKRPLRRGIIPCPASGIWSARISATVSVPSLPELNHSALPIRYSSYLPSIAGGGMGPEKLADSITEFRRSSGSSRSTDSGGRLLPDTAAGSLGALSAFRLRRVAFDTSYPHCPVHAPPDSNQILPSCVARVSRWAS